MKAIVCSEYGSPDVLQLKEIDKPRPAEDEVLIKVYAASVTAADCMMRRGSPFYARLFIGLMRPKNPVTGTGFAGVIEEVGRAVTQFKTGDLVFGETGVNFSANAEYLCLPEYGVLATMPTNMGFEQAAPLCDGALTSLSFLKDVGKIRCGQSALVNGASGSLGSAAVQIAKYFGAIVTGVCSTANVEMVRSLGADQVIDYTKVDFTQQRKTYDLIFDTVGKSSYRESKKALTPDGIYLSPVLGLPLLLYMLWTSKLASRRAKFSATGLRPASELRLLINELKVLFEAGKFKSIIDRRYPLEQAAKAHCYVDTGHKKGNVVLSIVSEVTLKT